MEDEETDEFAPYFTEGRKPNPIITTGLTGISVRYPHAHLPMPNILQACSPFIRALLKVIPELKYYKRRSLPLKKITEFAIARDVTDLIVIHQNNHKVNILDLETILRL